MQITAIALQETTPSTSSSLLRKTKR